MYKNKNNNLNNEYLKIKFHYLNYNIVYRYLKLRHERCVSVGA